MNSACSSSRTSTARDETKQIGRKKSVRFAPRTKGYIIPNIQSMSRRTKQLLWQTPEEKKNDENEMLHTVRKIRKGQQIPFDDPDMCARGLESIGDYAVLLRKRNQREALLNAVLGTQELQWQLGHRQGDKEDIREASIRCTKTDTQRAISIASRDAVEARKIHKLSLKKQVQEAKLRSSTCTSNPTKQESMSVRVANRCYM